MMRHFTFLLGLILFLSAGNSLAEAVGCKSHKYYEKDYQQAWCAASGGTTEYVLPDKARVDCVTNTHAIEFDFAKNGLNLSVKHCIMVRNLTSAPVLF